MSNRIAAALVTLVQLALSACGGGKAVDPPLPPPPTSSIGGNVTGLNGTLVLQNSNGTQATVTSNGAFTFASEMALGASYNVTVAVPPNSQTCTIANGTGSVGTSDVTNIAVTCVTNAFLLHVTVAGLDAGKSVTLMAAADGGSANLTVNDNATHAFPLNLAAGAEYLVSVTAQPAGQTCTLANAEGDIDPVIIANVGVTCIDSSASTRDWTVAEPVATDTDLTDTNSISHPQIGYDAAGQALVVWQADRVGEQGSDLYSRRYVRGSGWTAPVIVPRLPAPLPEFAGADNRRDPVLAVKSNGDAVVVFHWGGPRNLAVSFYTRATNSWSEIKWIFLLHADIPGNTNHVNVSIDDDGDTLVVFEAAGLPMYTRYIPGTGWLADVTLGKLVAPIVNNSASSEPTLGTNAAGDAVAMWKRHAVVPNVGAAEDHLFSSRYDRATDTWSDPLLVDQDDLFDGDDGVYAHHDVLLDSAGNATAVWTQFDGQRTHIMYNRLTGNTWGTPAIVETGNDGAIGNAYDSRAAIDGSGNIMAMWLQNDVDDGHYVANRFVPGTGWGTQQDIGDYSRVGFGAASTEMKLVSNAAGDVIAMWTLYSGIGAENVLEPYQVVANEYSAATHLWGAPDVIDKEEMDTELGEASQIAVAMDDAGNATAVWKDVGSPQSGIRSSHFE